MQVILQCMFLQFKLYLAKMVDLVDFTYFAANHMRQDKFSTTFMQVNEEIFTLSLLSLSVRERWGVVSILV